MALDLQLAGLAMASTSGSWASPAPHLPPPSSGLFPTGMMRTLDPRNPHNPGDSDVLCPWVHVPPPRPHFLLLITQSLKSSPSSSNPTALCRCGQSPKAAGQRKVTAAGPWQVGVILSDTRTHPLSVRMSGWEPGKESSLESEQCGFQLGQPCLLAE